MPPLTEVQRLAIQRIQFFQDELAKHGLYAQCGGEQEFFAEAVDGTILPPIPNVRDLLSELNDFYYLERVYPEKPHKTTPNQQQFETVVGAKPSILRHPEMAPLAVAGSMHALKYQMLSRLQRINPKYGRMRYEAYPYPGTIDISAQHQTLSLHARYNDQYGLSLFRRGYSSYAHDGTYESNALIHYANSLLQIQKEGILLATPSQTSFEGYRKCPASPHVFEIGRNKSTGPSILITSYNSDGEQQSKKCRVENRIAGMDADPILVMLTTLGAAYHAVTTQATIFTGQRPPSDGWILTKSDQYIRFNKATLDSTQQDLPTRLEDALEVFANSQLMRDLLGAHLHDAIIEQYRQPEPGIGEPVRIAYGR